MSKKRAIIYICIISLITALALVFSFVSFNIAGKNYKSFVGFANAINPGLDYNGGIYAEYELNKPEDMSEADFETQFNETFERINSVIASTDVLNANIVKTEDGKIRIETANVGDNKNVLKTIGAGELKIRTSSSSTADVILSGKNVTSVFATQAQVNQWGIYIAFDNEGKIELSNATKNAASSKVTLYMFRGESENAFFQLRLHVSDIHEIRILAGIDRISDTVKHSLIYGCKAEICICMRVRCTKLESCCILCIFASD